MYRIFCLFYSNYVVHNISKRLFIFIDGIVYCYFLECIFILVYCRIMPTSWRQSARKNQASTRVCADSPQIQLSLGTKESVDDAQKAWSVAGAVATGITFSTIRVQVGHRSPKMAVYLNSHK
jgi:hypothetical protein